MTEFRHTGLRATIELALCCCAAVTRLPAGLVRPARPDFGFLAHLPDRPLPPVRRRVRITALAHTESMTQPALAVVEGAIRPGRIRMGMASFLVDHPRARFVIDPALCGDVHRQVLPEVPAPWRALVGLPPVVTGLGESLRRIGVTPESIDFVLPTHLHWDHIGGLLDLPADTPVWVRDSEWSWAMGTGAVPLAVARGAVRDRTIRRFDLDGPGVLTFDSSLDLFGDGSVIIVDLAGHTPGSVGVLVAADTGRHLLLAGDAVWHSRQITMLRQKSSVGRLVDADPIGAYRSVHRLRALPRGIAVIGAHDRDAWCGLVCR